MCTNSMYRQLHNITKMYHSLQILIQNLVINFVLINIYYALNYKFAYQQFRKIETRK